VNDFFVVATVVVVAGGVASGAAAAEPSTEAEKQPGQVTRLFRRPHAHGLIAKIPHSRRWRVSLAGRRTMTTAIKLREVAYPSLFAAAA